MIVPGYVYRQDWITSSDIVKSTNTTTFLYGDNIARRGLGGQAKVMRHRNNTIGIVTKWLPTMETRAFFTEEQWSSRPEIKLEIDRGFTLALRALNRGKNLCIPSSGIGTGLARLEKQAPSILHYIDSQINRLENLYHNLNNKK